jgi:hypothetical protein
MKALPWVWPYLLYYVTYAAAMCYYIITAALGRNSTLQNLLYLSSAGWATLMVLCLWPPLETLLPRVETEEGWKIVWRGGRKAAKEQQQGTRIFADGADDSEMQVAVAGYQLPEQPKALTVSAL